MRYRLRTLLILLAILPPLLAMSWWKYSAWRAERERREALRVRLDGLTVIWTNDLRSFVEFSVTKPAEPQESPPVQKPGSDPATLNRP
jgi:hypothetical protein